MYLGQETPRSKKFNPSKYNIERRPGTTKATVIPDTLKDQFAHEENSKHDWRLLFSEENPGKYAKFMDMEYSMKDFDNEQFLKKKLEPCMKDGCSQAFFKSSTNPQTRSSFRQNLYGQVYVESATPTEFNHNEFLKFKYNLQFTEAGRQGKQNNKQKNTGRSRRSDFVLPPQQTKKKMNGKQRPDAVEEAKMDCYTSDYDSSNPNSRCGSAVSKKSVQFPLLRVRSSPPPSPPPPSKIVVVSQRVENALEILRKSNVESFKAAVKDVCMSRYCPTNLKLTKTTSSVRRRSISPSPHVLPQAYSSAFNEKLRPKSSKMVGASSSSRTMTSKRNDKNGNPDQVNKRIPSWILKNVIQGTKLSSEEGNTAKRNADTFTSSRRNVLVGNSSHFKPFVNEISKEYERLQKLSSAGQLDIEIFGVGATAQKIVEMVSNQRN